MLDKRTVENLAADLFRAERAGVAMTAASALQPELDMDDAYAVQAALTALKIASGDTAAGYKIGLTSQPLQIARGTNEPIYGRIMSSGVHSSGCDLPMASFIQPRIEVELAFVLKTPLVGPGRTLLDAVRAVEYVLPALELVDTRVTAPDGALRLEDFVCDNSFGAGAVIGSCPFTPDKADLRWVSAICLRNGVIEDSGVAASVLNHPAAGLAWLANRLALDGESVPAGQVILGGTFMAPLAVHKGDTIHADYGPFGSVSCYFA